MIEVVDLFAGPGGLGEGFSAFAPGGRKRFKLKMSVEMDQRAYETLVLRRFYHEFSEAPEAYYSYLRGEIGKGELFARFPEESGRAMRGVLMRTIGSPEFPHEALMEGIRQRVERPSDSVVIGGPPCQAYSLIGRSVMGKKAGFASDPRHTLYKHYLRIIADVQPKVFIMENVKGLLSSKLDNELVLERMLEDFKRPASVMDRGEGRRAEDAEYKVFSFGEGKESSRMEDYVVKCEEHGIPQRRHRILLLGVRGDLGLNPKPLEKSGPVSVREVIGDLPRIRSRLSKEPDSAGAWRGAIRERFAGAKVSLGLHPGGEYVADRSYPGRFGKAGRAGALRELRGWLVDERLGGAVNHMSRSHIRQDLLRYYFMAEEARETGESKRLRHFPEDLLPNHRNVRVAIQDGTLFSDRFRVQLAGRPATTITSHIGKDGHYFIHYDKSQCRSLTVREAARIQAFPDSYKFEGGRTKQYQQVGNAVPPLLALKIAESVHELLSRGAAP